MSVETTISNVRVFPVNGHKTVRANVFFTVGDCVAIKATVMNGKNGLFVSFPGRSYEDAEGKKQWASDVKPVSKEANSALTNAILTAYQESQNGSATAGSPAPSNIPF